MRILLIFDQEVNLEKLRQRLNSIKPDYISLFPLTSQWGLIRNIEDLCQSYVDTRIELMESARLIDEEVGILRGKISGWSADLGDYNVSGKSLKEWFLSPKKEVSTWWFSLLSEKSVFKTDVFFRIAQAQAIEKLFDSKKCNICYISCRDIRLMKVVKKICERYSAQIEPLRSISLKRYIKKESIKRYLREFGFLKDTLHSVSWLAVSIVRGLKAKVIMGPLGNRRLEKDSVLFVTYFPAVDKRAAENGVFKNRYASFLQTKLSEMEKPISWLFMYGPLERQSHSHALRLGKKFADNDTSVFFIEEFLSIRVILNSIFTWMTQLVKYLFLIFELNQGFLTEGLTIPEADILLYPVWRKSFVGKTGIEGILYFELYKRVFDYFGGSSHCIYYAEMQAWEKALNAAKRWKAKKIKIIGFQHTIVSRNYFQYFHDNKEMQEKEKPVTLPLPDVLACNGNISYGLLKRQNYPNLVEVEAIRQLYLVDYLKNDKHIQKRKRILLVVGSYNVDETALLISLLHSAFSGAQPFRIWIKSHPATPVNRVFKLLKIDHKKCEYQIKEDSIDMLLKDATMVLVGFSSVGLQALVFDCEIFIPVFCEQMFVNPLEGFDRFYTKVYSPEGLRNIVERNMHLIAKEKTTNERRDLISNYWCLDESLTRWEKLLC